MPILWALSFCLCALLMSLFTPEAGKKEQSVSSGWLSTAHYFLSDLMFCVLVPTCCLFLSLLSFLLTCCWFIMCTAVQIVFVLPFKKNFSRLFLSLCLLDFKQGVHIFMAAINDWSVLTIWLFASLIHILFCIHVFFFLFCFVLL